ncbi:74_t:CDS:1, partial [Gigaspora rosea]
MSNNLINIGYENSCDYMNNESKLPESISVLLSDSEDDISNYDI